MEMYSGEENDIVDEQSKHCDTEDLCAPVSVRNLRSQARGQQRNYN